MVSASGARLLLTSRYQSESAMYGSAGRRSVYRDWIFADQGSAVTRTSSVPSG